MQELKSLGDFCTTPDFHSLFCRALTCICGKFSLHIAAAMILPYPTQGKHPAHSMSSHCALHSSHLSISKEVLSLPENCRSGIGQSPLLGHVSFIFHHQAQYSGTCWRKLSSVAKASAHQKTRCNHQYGQGQEQNRGSTVIQIFVLLMHTSQCSVSLFSSKATLGTL